MLDYELHLSLVEETERPGAVFLLSGIPDLFLFATILARSLSPSKDAIKNSLFEPHVLVSWISVLHTYGSDSFMKQHRI